MAIRYLKHKEIDKEKWNFCVSNAVNSMIYGMSWYLDIVCENWDALISDDYEAVMPLPWKKKFGLKYVYHPFFAQQLGVFYRKIADDQTYEFLQKIPKSFLKYDASLNYLNMIKKLSLNIKTNYVLSLNKSCEELAKNFSENTRRNIKKSEKENLSLTESISLETFFTIKKNNALTQLSDTQYGIMYRLINELITLSVGKIKGVVNENGELIGAVFLVYFKSRITYLFSVSTEQGKDKKAMFWLINQLIKENAGKQLMLDFEGSMIEGVARFFKGFGSQKETYYRYSKSKIPFFK
ncbi:MAG: hypothetical protein JEZ09_08750 [Salinivirgaceae bacterium]|nr:hypothetical protein [Salinivirgaceae bacterium]